MTALSLFDLVAAVTDSGLGNAGKKDRQRQLPTIAASMVSSAIQQFERIRELDEALAPPSAVDDAIGDDMDVAVAIRLMYEEAANEAERILSRIDRLERRSMCVVAGSAELRDWHGKTMAMLSVTLEDIARGTEQAKRGELVTASELRDELRNRLHP